MYKWIKDIFFRSLLCTALFYGVSYANDPFDHLRTYWDSNCKLYYLNNTWIEHKIAEQSSKMNCQKKLDAESKKNSIVTEQYSNSKGNTKICRDEAGNEREVPVNEKCWETHVVGNGHIVGQPNAEIKKGNSSMSKTTGSSNYYRSYKGCMLQCRSIAGVTHDLCLSYNPKGYCDNQKDLIIKNCENACSDCDDGCEKNF